MSFNKIVHLATYYAKNNEDMPERLPCKPHIQAVRELDQSAKDDDSKFKALEAIIGLRTCLAQYHVDANNKIRSVMGIASYNEYKKKMEDEHGPEMAARLVAEPEEKLKDLKALQMVMRIQKNQHPRGEPKSKEDLKNWSHVDQIRLEMGEEAWFQKVGVLVSEFGIDKVDELLGVKKSGAEVKAAFDRVLPDLNAVKEKEKNVVYEVADIIRKNAPDLKWDGTDYYDDLTAAIKFSIKNDEKLKTIFQKS